MNAPYRPDLSLRGKLRRRAVRLRHRRPAARAPGLWLTVSFDDAPESALTAGLPIVEAAGARATLYVCAGLAGTTAHLGRFADADQVRAAAARGHEIGCHTFSHRDFGRASGAEAAGELDRNAHAFAAWGLPRAETFAYPYGDVAGGPKAEVARRFALGRALHPGELRRGGDLAQSPAVSTDGRDGEASALAALRRAAARGGGWVILFGHQVTDAPGEFATAPDTLRHALTAARELGFEPLTAAEGARRLAA